MPHRGLHPTALLGEISGPTGDHVPHQGLHPTALLGEISGPAGDHVPHRGLHPTALLGEISGPAGDHVPHRGLHVGGHECDAGPVEELFALAYWDVAVDHLDAPGVEAGGV